MKVARALDDVLAAVFPGTCPCGARGEPCCARCHAALTPAPAAPPPAGIDWWVAAFAYAGVARELVARAKYRNARASFVWLGASIAEHLPRAHDRDIVTWIPASRARRLGSGVDHGELLARVVARGLHLPVRSLLHRAPGTPQTGAPRAERRCGPRLRAIASVDGLNVLVVDDVATTGASLAAAAIALRTAGARTVAAATATRTPAPGRP
jgi:predicted amidophosphoribosyltransferase